MVLSRHAGRGCFHPSRLNFPVVGNSTGMESPPRSSAQNSTASQGQALDPDNAVTRDETVDEVVRPAVPELEIDEELPIEDALEQRQDVDELPQPRRAINRRTRTTEASEADEIDQHFEVGFDDDHEEP
jgi:hypothetical protein